ncbi:MAG: PBS lyase [Deltaproteobacteria bacterium]|nr:PBS lyase [Deltaproteobacteria bacterium]
MLESRFQGREIIEKPACPFCGGHLDRPQETNTGEMPLGSCSCGAVFACDVTGHNLGTAMSEALVAACQGDWDSAWNLLPEEDYLEKQVRNYDYVTHLIIHGTVYQGRRIAGTLLFIRLHKPVTAVEKAPPLPSSPSPRGRNSFSKKDVEALVEAYDLKPLLGAAEQDKRILRDLKRLLYSADPLLRWRAADSLGQVSAVIARTDPGAVTRLLQGLFSSLTDTAASSWGALDAIGEIIRRQPGRFSGFIPQLVQMSRNRSLLEGVLRTLGKIAEEEPDLLRRTSYQITALLHDVDPGVRGHAAILLGNLKAAEARGALDKLSHDPAEIAVYRNGMIEKKSVGQLADEALAEI